DLFDRIVDSIKLFDPETQRSLSTVSDVSVGPAAELLLSADMRAEGAQKIAEAGTMQAERLRRQGALEAAQALADRTAAHAERVREGQYFEGLDQYLSYFYPRAATVLDYVRSGAIVFDDPARLKEQFGGAQKDLNESHALLLEKRSEEHTSELQSRENLVCRLLLEKKKRTTKVTERI